MQEKQKSKGAQAFFSRKFNFFLFAGCRVDANFGLWSRFCRLVDSVVLEILSVQKAI